MLALVLKLTLAPALVATATSVAGRLGHRAGGLVGGLPVVAGPILLIYAVEQGQAFAAEAAAGAVLGIVSLVGFCLAYALAARHHSTAVALAAALEADVCEIYTDVAGVFSADPRIVPDARKLSVVSFEEMLEMSASGAGVLQLRSVEYARNHNLPIHCRSSFDDAPGTFVQSEEVTMERPLVTAITHSTDEARITLTDLPDRPGIAGRVLTVLADSNMNVDMIIQNEPQSDGQLADMSFTVPRDDLPTAIDALEAVREELGIGAVTSDPDMAKVSVVGAGMKSYPGVAAKTFSVLGQAGVNIEMISTSPIKISCVIREEHVERAVRELHAAFELGDGTIHREDVRGDHRPVVG